MLDKPMLKNSKN